VHEQTKMRSAGPDCLKKRKFRAVTGTAASQTKKDICPQNAEVWLETPQRGG
jgi:hypothetical protein